MVIVEDQTGSQSRGSRPGDTQIVLVLSYLFTLGLIDWSLAAVGSECVFGDLKREDNRMGTYDGGLHGTSCERTTETAGHHGRGINRSC